MATIFVRYEDSDSGQIVETSQTLQRSDLLSRFDDASTSFQLAAVVAEFAEILRNSYWAQDGSMAQVLAEARRLQDLLADSDSDVAEFARHRRPCPQGSRPPGTLDESYAGGP